MFTRAIVRTPGKSLVDGISTAGLGRPDYALAIEQHERYRDALEACGLEVTVLAADEDYPDSVFVEDTALLTGRCAIATCPGAAARRGEVAQIRTALEDFYARVETIEFPATVEAGDIMMVGSHFYIGLSARTNQAGVERMTEILRTHGYDASTIRVSEALHLKSSVSYLENNHLVVTGQLCGLSELAKFNRIELDQQNSYAANCVWINDSVLVATGFPQASEKIAALGYRVVELDVSEYRKLDGGLSCMSLRF